MHDKVLHTPGWRTQLAQRVIKFSQLKPCGSMPFDAKFGVSALEP